MICPRIKKQCPETNKGKKGCSFWVVPGEGVLLNAKSSDKFPAKGVCLEHLKILMLWDANVTLIGNQQATETFRNGMTEEVNGKTRPKLDIASAMLLKVMSKQGELLIDGENIKRITGG
jgi:hypothetical protein